MIAFKDDSWQMIVRLISDSIKKMHTCIGNEAGGKKRCAEVATGLQ